MDVRNQVSAHTNSTEKFSNLADQVKIPVSLDTMGLCCLCRSSVSKSFKFKHRLLGNMGYELIFEAFAHY